MLNEKNASNKKGGKGKVIMPSNINNKIGTDKLPCHSPLNPRKAESLVTVVGNDLKWVKIDSAIALPSNDKMLTKKHSASARAKCVPNLNPATKIIYVSM